MQKHHERCDVSLCVHYHVNITINEYLKDQWDGCKHNEWSMWLKDGAIQVEFVRWWKRLSMIGKTCIELIKLWAKSQNLGLSMKGCKFDGHQTSHKKEC
jgi:hypothetical protein